MSRDLKFNLFNLPQVGEKIEFRKSLENQTIGNTITKCPLQWFGDLMLRSFETYNSDFSLTTLKRVVISKEEL